MTSSGVHLREITDENRAVVCALCVRPGQERFVASVARSLDDAAATPEANPWYRAVYLDNEPVGFVMLSWNVPPGRPGIIGPYFLWRLFVEHSLRLIHPQHPATGGQHLSQYLPVPHSTSTTNASGAVSASSRCMKARCVGDISLQCSS